MARILPTRRRYRTHDPTVAVKKNGRVILNRPAASFFEDAGVGKVILIWDEETNTLSVKGVESHRDEHLVYYGGSKGIPAALSAKTALSSIGYDFSENRTFAGTLNWSEKTLEVLLSPEYCPYSRAARNPRSEAAPEPVLGALRGRAAAT